MKLKEMDTGKYEKTKGYEEQTSSSLIGKGGKGVTSEPDAIRILRVMIFSSPPPVSFTVT